MTILRFILRLLFRQYVTPHVDPYEAWRDVAYPSTLTADQVDQINAERWQD